MAHYEFHKDLEESKKAVALVKDYYKKHKYEVKDMEGKKEQIKGDFMYYNGKKVSINECYVEVKYDIMSEKTGNLCFEIYNGSGRPTGILRTTADEIVYVVKRKKKFNLIFFDAEELRSWIFNPENYNKSRLVSGGDGRKYKMLIIKESDALDIAYKVVKNA